MSTTILLYADNEYYFLEYSNHKSHKFIKVYDNLNQLQNVMPQYIHSMHNNHCIVDINNGIHLLYLEELYFFGKTYFFFTCFRFL